MNTTATMMKHLMRYLKKNHEEETKETTTADLHGKRAVGSHRTAFQHHGCKADLLAD